MSDASCESRSPVVVPNALTERGKRFAWDALYIGVTLVVAYSLKQHYSVATADQLGWILAPTARVVEGVLGTPFVEEAHAGFISRELEFVIAPSCAGVNFLIIAFTMLVFAFLRTRRSASDKCLLVVGSAVVAYGVTLFVNSARIVFAIWLRERDVTFGILNDEAVHRVEGVVVYFVSLCVLFVVARAVLGPPALFARRLASDGRESTHA
jgi:exosortase K